jgi:hypothetical protein
MDWWRGVEPFGIGVEENPVTAVKKLVDASLAYDAEVKRQEQGRRIDFWKRDDLSYLEALVDMAPLLSARVDMPDPLTRWWKDAILNLIAVSKEAARHQERLLEDTDTPQPGHEVEHETGDGPDAIGMRRVIDAAVKYIHGGSDADSRQENYDAWRETYKDVFGDAL